MILLDLNVLLDVVQRREPHYGASAAVIEEVIHGRIEAALPAHAVTTLHYIVGRYQDPQTANGVVDWLLRYFAIAAVGQQVLQQAPMLAWEDFEDAVVATSAELAGCEVIVTRNVKDFPDPPVSALTPEEYLMSLS